MMMLLSVIPQVSSRSSDSSDPATLPHVGPLHRGVCSLSALQPTRFWHRSRGTSGRTRASSPSSERFSLWALARFMSDDGRRLVVPTLLAAFGVNLLVATIQVVGRRSRTAQFALFLRSGHRLHSESGVSRRVDGGWDGVVYPPARHSDAPAVDLVGGYLRVLGRNRVLRIAGGAAVRRSSPSTASFGLNRVWAAFGFVSFASGASSSAASSCARSSDPVATRYRDSGKATSSGGRFPTWRAATDAVIETPFFGWGLGRFRFAVQGRLSVEDMAVLNGASFFDAHNVVVGLAVAVGVPGLIVFAGFSWTTARRMIRRMVSSWQRS